MAGVLRGSVYWADLNPVTGSEQGGLRPVLVLSHNVFNSRSGTVIAAALTSRPQRAGFPLTLELANEELPKKSWVKISQVRTLSTKRLKEKITEITEEELSLVIEGLNEIISG